VSTVARGPPVSEEQFRVPDTIPVDLVPQGPSFGALVNRYGQYVALFVGAGLISGSVVHFPLAPTRYAIIGGVGAAIFALASVLGERAGKDAAGLVRLALSSLALALGIGMMSGSVQHFQDIPDRAARLIPIGLLLSAAAFVVRNELRRRRTTSLLQRCGRGPPRSCSASAWGASPSGSRLPRAVMRTPPRMPSRRATMRRRLPAATSEGSPPRPRSPTHTPRTVTRTEAPSGQLIAATAARSMSRARAEPD
jgi:hypothetical protein